MVRPVARNFIDVDQALRARIAASAERIIKLMSPAAKATAVESADLPDFFLNLARGIPAAEIDDPEVAEGITSTIAFKRRMMDRAGGVLSASATQSLLGHKTVQAVYKAARERRLLMIEDNGTKLFPSFQFDGNMVRPAIPQILSAAPHASGWTILQYLVGGPEGSQEKRRIDLIKGSPADVERVVRFARTLED